VSTLSLLTGGFRFVVCVMETVCIFLVERFCQCFLYPGFYLLKRNKTGKRESVPEAGQIGRQEAQEKERGEESEGG